MLVIDYSQILISNCLSFGSDFNKGADLKKMEMVSRHTVLNTILSYKRQYGKKYGDVVIAVDGMQNWRKAYFPYYKGARKANREESETDWATIFKLGNQIIEDLISVFPYKVVRVDEAEADDVIAVLCKYSQDNELLVEGLEETPRKFLAVSSDGDFKQLFKYPNYAQYSPIQRKAVKRPEPDFLIEKIIKGDAGDGIPSVLCADDFFLKKDLYGRATPITKKIIEKFKSGKNLTDLERARFERNSMLIDFSLIPQSVQNSIIENYTNQTPLRDKNAIFEYCAARRLRQLAENIHDFF